MNLKKYKKLRKRIEIKPVEWLNGNVRIHNYYINHQIKYVYQVIDTDLIYTARLVFVPKVFIEIISALKKKTGVDFKLICFGNGTYRIIPKFIFETKQKAESGDATAMFEYSEYLKEFHTLKEAHEWHTKAAKSGNPRAMAGEGNFIIHGWVEGSLTDAFYYFQKAAEIGYKNAYENLGECYLYGWGCEQDFQKAREYYKKASWWKHRKIIKQLSKKDFCLKTDGKEVLEKIREFYN